MIFEKEGKENQSISSTHAVLGSEFKATYLRDECLSTLLATFQVQTLFTLSSDTVSKKVNSIKSQ